MANQLRWLRFGGTYPGRGDLEHTTVPFGASHALGHSLGGTAAVPHGYTSCVMLPAVVAYNLEGGTIGIRGASELAEVFGRGPIADAIAAFIAELGMPRSLREVGVRPEDLPAIAKMVMKDPWLKTNPRPVGQDDALRILRSALGASAKL